METEDHHDGPRPCQVRQNGARRFSFTMNRSHGEFRSQLGLLQQNLREVKGQYEETVVTIRGLGTQMEAAASAQTEAITKLLTAQVPSPSQIPSPQGVEQRELAIVAMRRHFARWKATNVRRRPTPDRRPKARASLSRSFERHSMSRSPPARPRTP